MTNVKKFVILICEYNEKEELKKHTGSYTKLFNITLNTIWYLVLMYTGSLNSKLFT